MSHLEIQTTYYYFCKIPPRKDYRMFHNGFVKSAKKYIDISNTPHAFFSFFLTGLLANLWEFPHIALTEEGKDEWEDTVRRQVTEQFGIPESCASSRTFIADVTHIFSHIRQTCRQEDWRNYHEN